MSYGQDNYYNQRPQDPFMDPNNEHEMQSVRNPILVWASQINEQIAIINNKRNGPAGPGAVDWQDLSRAQYAAREQSDNPGARQNLQNVNRAMLKQIENLNMMVRQMKGESGANDPANIRHVKKADKDTRDVIREFQRREGEHRQQTAGDTVRQLRIVDPGMDENFARQQIANGAELQVFAEAIKQGNRSGLARGALEAAQERFNHVQAIERQMQELAQLFTTLNDIVIVQDEQIVDIEHKGEEVVENLDKGNEEVGVAVNTARATRKKKWICLGISVIIIIIIVVVVVIVVNPSGGDDTSNNNNNAQKRAIMGLFARVAELDNGDAYARHPVARRLPPREHNLGARWMVAMT